MAGDDNSLRPWLYSIAVHLLVLALVSVSLWWTRSTVAVAIPGPIIEATLVGPAQAPAPKNVKKPVKPVKQPEPKPEEVKPKADEPAPEKPKEDRKDQEKITDKITQQKAEEDARLQEELRKKEQIELAERQAAEAEKKKKLEEEKAKQLRDQKQRELDKKAEAERLAAMIADEAKSGQEGTDTSLEAEYYAAIQSAVTNAWLRPESTPPGVRCTLEITQIIGGDVIQAVVVEPCNADAPTRTTLEQAPQRASPLPYKGYESVFKRKIRFEFTYDG
ncbi:MAG TPA: cell envelope integrity protein TolA [Tahibacter sp.]|uniref:cell envelope integrity protein TolA n=1 Tax=Tahibacter sp. TaxID=2056211 RepID=UPI002C745E01|nr:cell envelope integrity protein TolA [Tahibacter sp.]HSX60050.1 cell envelope integrity protein TolA [Tahibacter sp.]